MQARWFRHLINLWPPFVGAGIRVTRITPDWRRLEVEMGLRWYNRNYVGTHFGGSLFAMTDPFLMLMAIHNLGREYVVWDRAGEIEFVAPGRSRVTAVFQLAESDLEEMRAHTSGGEKYLRWFSLEIRGEDGALVARVRRQLYVRRARESEARRQTAVWVSC
ncbi:MAG TPA: DUF4442 domain-containing protein [Polyangiaceae bacterium]|jgi:acyl-coenzyme A thioesterase PaaI-like protein|nr:DUF4442 domain-containing protein [Polyangiaceae bacterium]